MHEPERGGKILKQAELPSAAFQIDIISTSSANCQIRIGLDLEYYPKIQA
jgi:hypothetical protein